jgi:PTS system cellobiose-specific IIA component
MTNLEQTCFSIISNAGQAKSALLEVIDHALEHEFGQAEQKLSQASSFMLEAHKIHARLIMQEAAGTPVQVNLLLVHAEDQMMAVETIQILANTILKRMRKEIE